jgi:hypothetical protein
MADGARSEPALGSRPVPVERDLTVTDAVTGARVVTVVGPVDREVARRFRDGVRTLARWNGRPIVVDLRRAPGDEILIASALRDITSAPCAPPVSLVIEPRAVEVWTSIDHAETAVYPTLSAALEPGARCGRDPHR